MSKSSKNKKNRGRRAANVPSSQRYTYRVHSPAPLRLSPLNLSFAGDRRFFQPDRPSAPIFSLKTRAASRIVAKQNPSFRQPSQTKAILTFAEPTALPLCIRRKIRKQVIHAKGVAGTKVRKPHRNFWSSITC